MGSGALCPTRRAVVGCFASTGENVKRDSRIWNHFLLSNDPYELKRLNFFILFSLAPALGTTWTRTTWTNSCPRSTRPKRSYGTCVRRVCPEWPASRANIAGPTGYATTSTTRPGEPQCPRSTGRHRRPCTRVFRGLATLSEFVLISMSAVLFRRFQIDARAVFR